MSELYRFAAFISYSSSDAAFAQRLHRALESYSIPTQLGAFDILGGGKKNRLFPVFRDREELPSGELGQAIEAALKASNSMIVVCSPKAAASPWVNKEIETFMALGRRGRIFAIIADTAPVTDASGADATAASFPPAFRGDALGPGGAFEPLAADARRGKDGFRNAWLKIVAGIIGVNAGVLQDRDRKRRRGQRQRLAAGAAALALGLSYGAVWLETAAWRGALSDYPELVKGTEREIDAAAFAIAGAGDPGDLVPARGARADEVLIRAGSVKRLRDLGRPLKLDVSPDGAVVVTKTREGRATIIDATGRLPDRPAGIIDDYVMSADGRVLVTATREGQGAIYDLVTGGDPRSLGQLGRSPNLHITHDGRYLVVEQAIEQTPSVTLYNLQTREATVLGPVKQLGGVNLSPYGSTLATETPEGVLKVYDLARSPIPRDLGIVKLWYLSQGGDALVAQRRDGSAVFLDISGGAEPVPFDPPEGLDNAGLSRRGAVLIARRNEATSEILYLMTGERQMHQNPPEASLSGPDATGGYAISIALGKLGLFDLQTKQPVFDLKEVRRWAMSEDGASLVVQAPDQTAVLYDLSGGSAPKPLGDIGPTDQFYPTRDGAFLFAPRPDGTAIFVDLKGAGGIKYLGDVGKLAPFDDFGQSTTGVIAMRREAVGATLYDALAPSPAVDANGAKLGGAALRDSVCSANADTIRPFPASLRAGAAPGNVDDARVHAILAGRPWNACDWRGLGWGAEGWAQWMRRVEVSVLGDRSRDYKCGEINAAGDTSPIRIESCRRAGVPEAMIATAK